MELTEHSYLGSIDIIQQTRILLKVGQHFEKGSGKLYMLYSVTKKKSADITHFLLSLSSLLLLARQLEKPITHNTYVITSLSGQ